MATNRSKKYKSAKNPSSDPQHWQRKIGQGYGSDMKGGDIDI